MNETLPGSETLAPSRIDEEDIRLTTGFADIFTAILLVVGGSILMAFPLLGGMGIVAAAFGLGWPLVQRRHFAACGNVLALGNALGAGLTFALLHWSAALIAGAIASFFYWRVHRVPSALALTWICATGLVIALGNAGLDMAALWWTRGNIYSLLAGIVLFAGAMWYDSHDRLRQGRLSDVAFWLHLISAPLFVHGLFAALGVNPFLDTGISPAVVLGIFLALTLVSLAIDRRPLLASSFVYLVAATAALLRDGWQSGEVVDGGQQFLNAAMAPAVIGVLLLGLAAGWTPLRRVILQPMPERLTEQLPPTARKAEPADDTPDDLPAAEKEPVRLVLGFNDFFVALGAGALFVGSIFVGLQLASMTAGGWMRMVESQAILSAPMWLPVVVPALAMWLVAEYFVRIRRMAWPAISAAVWFSFAAWSAGLLAAFQYAASLHPGLFPANSLSWGGEALPTGLAIQCVLIATMVLLAANLAFWWRHRVPVSFALAIAALVPLAFIDLIVRELTDAPESLAAPDWAPRLLAAGVAVFALAMWWDRRDVARQTQRADTAFWLHLLAAALAVPAAYALTRNFGDTVAMGLVGAGFVGLVALALAIDRRAPLVVALPFALANTGEWIGNLAIVLALLALVLRWDQVRGLLLGSLRPKANFATPPAP